METAGAESIAISLRVRKGIWRRIRFSDMDTDSLIRFCELLDEENRFPFYKRIADLCLFILGIFPEYAYPEHRWNGKARPKLIGRLRRSADEYEREAKTFYRLAEGHTKARLFEIEEALYELHENFDLARGCLSFVSEHYLKFRRGRLFDLG